MPGMLERARWAIARKIAPKPPGFRSAANAPQAPGGFSFGTSWWGGPQYTDVFNSRRAPTPWALVERYKSLIFALVARKRDAVAAVPIRLMADGSRVQGGRPRSACDPIRVARGVAKRHARAGMVSSAAVDQIYEVRNHPILDVLDNPDPYGNFDRRKLIGLMVAQQDVVGSAYLVPEGNGWDWRDTTSRKKGPPEYLWVVYPQYVTPIRQGDSPQVDHFQYFRDRLPFDAVLWFKQSVSLRDPYGSAYSPTYAGDMYADQEQRMISIADQMLGMGPRPNLVATAKDPMMPPGETERLRFEQDLNRRQAGPNAGGVLVNNGAWEFTPINQPPADSSWKDLSEYDRNCLSALFGVPPTFFTTDTNLANLQAADAFFARFGVEPMLHSICATLTALVKRWDPRLYFMHDPVLDEDEKLAEEVKSMQIASGRKSIDQVNEEDTIEPQPWGKEPLFNKNMVPWSILIKQAEQGLEQAKMSMENESKMTDFQTSEEPGDEAEARALVARAKWLTREIEGRLAG